MVLTLFFFCVRVDIHTNLSARRRVSFEIPPHQEDAVPPSPNTRRKNFNFMPISPGPVSPRSKCSSTTASPFVSPRNTPVPRSKPATSYNAALPPMKRRSSLKIKQEAESEYEYLAMSAPPSPKLNAKTKNATLLQSLLNSNNKILLADNYAKQTAIQDPLTVEISKLLSADSLPVSGESAFRSHSVPLNQMGEGFAPQLPFSVSESNSITQTPIPNEFGEYDSFTAAAENINMNKILSSLDTIPTSSEDVFGMEMEAQPNIPDAILPNLRALSRSQSIDVDLSGYSEFRYNPSRSVPATPIPSTSKALSKSYRSYPSTPLTSGEEAFCYTPGQDYLINGQPIKPNLDMINVVGSESNDGIFFNVDDNLNCEIEFNFDGQLPDGAFKQNVSVDENGGYEHVNSNS